MTTNDGGMSATSPKDTLGKCGVRVELSKNDEGNTVYYFPIGAPFLCQVPTNTNNNRIRIHVGPATRLCISTATCCNTAGPATTLYLETTQVTEALPLCHWKSSPPGTISGLGMECCGPRIIQLFADADGDAQQAIITVCGSITRASEEDTIKDGMPAGQENEEMNGSSPAVMAVEADEGDARRDNTRKRRRHVEHKDVAKANEKPMGQEEEEDKPAEANSAASNKNGGEVSVVTEPDGGPGDARPTLSKKQRKALAKQKAKELAETVAILNDHHHSGQKEVVKEATKKKQSGEPITKERRLAGGVLVRDFILGDGAVVKAGRKVSILYEGSFPSGKVFDKNQSRKNPLTFRQGTGEVIRGLERGLEGMRVGGERHITIPPGMGYGKKGGPGIPGNAILLFSIQLIGVGGR